MQPGRDQRLVAVGQHVNRDPVGDISDDAPELPVNLRLINAQPLWQPRLVFGVELLDVVARQGADGLVIAANMLSHAHEGVAQALRLDVLDAPLCHPHGAVDAAQRLDERAPAFPALEPFCPGQDAHVPASDRAVADGYGLRAMAVQAANDATLLAKVGADGVLGLNLVFVAVKALVDDGPAIQVKDVGHQTTSDGFMKTYQCVSPLRPVGWPNRGCTSVRARTSRIFTWVSFHLKTKTPSLASTRKHSLNPLRMSSCQVSDSLPYFFVIQLLGPAVCKCGGSKTTSLKLPSSNGISVKSSSMSGSIRSVRPSHSTWLSDRLSPYTTSGFCLSNQNILLPQQGSRTRRPPIVRSSISCSSVAMRNRLSTRYSVL
uniref:Uncharacterized protein n=1 Tax=Ralstonia solanacearum TaxID=305 RepID=H6U8T7_RALSL|nr:hypothetical protein [Ralstonia solanacearum]